jgi:hypothetical protein
MCRYEDISREMAVVEDHLIELGRVCWERSEGAPELRSWLGLRKPLKT